METRSYSKSRSCRQFRIWVSFTTAFDQPLIWGRITCIKCRCNTLDECDCRVSFFCKIWSSSWTFNSFCQCCYWAFESQHRLKRSIWKSKLRTSSKRCRKRITTRWESTNARTFRVSRRYSQKQFIVIWVNAESVG